MLAVTPPLATILVVEHERMARRRFAADLEMLGYRIVTSDQAIDVLNVVEAQTPDLVLLDVDVRDGDAYGVCERLRMTSSIPIIVVSAVDRAADKAHALACGADDYIVRPYDPLELAARIGAILRRMTDYTRRSPVVFRCGQLTIDFSQRRVVLGTQEIELSKTEYRLLECLAQNAGRTIVADTLVSNVWGPSYLGDYASLHLYISRLRRKLGEDAQHSRYIITKPGIGYTMPAEEHEYRSVLAR